MKIIMIILLCISFVEMVEIVVEKVDWEYYNPKYFSYLNITLRRYRRNGPYNLSLNAKTLTVIGNNLTVKWAVYEIIGGHHVLTPLRLQYSFCDLLHKDVVIGTMLQKQLPSNWTCPLPAGYATFKDLIYNLDQLPYIPSTFSSLYFRIYIVVEAFFNKNDSAIRWNFNFAVKQKYPV